jgi:hypothetical protein
VEVVDEHEHAGSGVASSEADVVELAVVAHGDDAGGVDAVAADPIVTVDDRRAGRVALGRAAKASAGVCRCRARCGRRVL